jgi:two-component system sensor histidine kinase UhpB
MKEERDYSSNIVNTNPALIVILDSEGKIIQVNKACEIATGYRMNEVIGREFTEIPLFPTNVFLHNAEDSGKKEKKFQPRFESYLAKKDGTPNIITWSSTEVSNSRDSSEWIITGIDITEQKQAEEALRESEERFRQLVEAAFEGVVITKKGKLIEVSNEFAEMFGYNPSELIGVSAGKLIAPENRKETLKKIISGFGEPYETICLKKNGSRFYVEVSDKSISYQGENARITAVRDISERKRVEQELKSSREQLRNLNIHLQKVREEESTRIARELHDELGQHLSLFKLDLSLLESGLQKGEQSYDEKIKIMKRNVDSTIEKVREISRELRPSMLDSLGLTPAIEWLAEEFQNQTGIECNLSDKSGGVKFNQDISNALFRVIQESLTNVLRHSEASKVYIDLNINKRESIIDLKIADNGNGITDEQMINSKSVGLIGMKERVRNLNGIFKISGIPNKGTTLTVNIPLKE